MRNALYACDNDGRYSEVAYPPLVLKADLADLFLNTTFRQLPP